jgi:electron transfer flavoprotein alpha subunit
MTDTLVVAEISEGKVKKASLAAIGFAKKVGGAFDVIVLGENTAGAAQELAAYGARKVIRGEIAGGYVCERYAPTIAAAAKAGGHGVVVACSTSFGRDVMPRVAAKLGAGFASDVIGVASEGGKLAYRRSIYAGNVLGTCTVSTPVAAVTVRQSEFELAAPAGGASPVEEIAIAADPAADRVEFVKLEAVKSERPDLAEAAIVVSGGRALKSAENFKNVLEPLVDSLNAAMGASRAACDAGYVPNDLQVGQTGKVVAPKLYIAVGISGAIQHLAGMKGSKTIVAINKDKEAPIAQVADYFVVADLFEAVPALTAEVQKIRAQG